MLLQNQRGPLNWKGHDASSEVLRDDGAWSGGAGAEVRDGTTSQRAHVTGGEGAWLGAMDRVHGWLDVALARCRWQRGLEVEGTGVASVVYDDVGVERLVAAGIGSGLGVAAAGCRWLGSAVAGQDGVGEGCFKACCFPAR